jgi:hypothetical protein
LEHPLHARDSINLGAIDVLQQHAQRTGMLLRLRARVSHSGHSHHVIQESHDFSPSVFCVGESSKNKIHSHRWQPGLRR